MEPFLITMVILGLLIVGGIVISFRINAHHLPGKGLFRRVRRRRTHKDGDIVDCHVTGRERKIVGGAMPTFVDDCKITT